MKNKKDFYSTDFNVFFHQKNIDNQLYVENSTLLHTN